MYKFYVNVKYSESSSLPYTIDVLENSATGKYEIQNQGFLNLPDIKNAVFVKVTNFNDLTKKIEQYLRSQVTELTNFSELSEIESAEPYYKFYFKSQDGTKYLVKLKYNLIEDKTVILDKKIIYA